MSRFPRPLFSKIMAKVTVKITVKVAKNAQLRLDLQAFNFAQNGA